jgi:thioester reductase-like protein
MGAECFAEKREMDEVAWLPSLVKEKDDVSIIQHSLAELHMRHVTIDWSAYYQPFDCRRVPLPTYPFQRMKVQPLEPSRPARSMEAEASESSSPAHEAEKQQSEFNVTWSPVCTSPGRTQKSWAVICLAGGETRWIAQTMVGMSRAGMKVREVKQLQEAIELEGILLLCGSESGKKDDDAGHVLCEAHRLTAAVLDQVQTAATLGLGAELVLVTRRAVGTGSEEEELDMDMDMAAAPLWGLARTARTEHPELRLRLVDMDNVNGDTQTKETLTLADALRYESESECAVRKGQVLVPQIEPSACNSTWKQTYKQRLLRRDGAVLLTGGLGEIAQQICRRLIQIHGITDLVLTSRRGLDSPGAAALVQELTQLGAHTNVNVNVQVMAADMSRRECVQAIMGLFSPTRPLRGVFHAAGLLDDGVFSSLTPQRCAAVYAPKVHAAWHLHQLTHTLDLDFFVMCSSLSGIIGNAGQANYAAANTFLDALAHLRRAARLPAVSVSLGLWGGPGMADRLGAPDLARYADMGIMPLALADGLDLLMRSALSGRPHVVAAACHLDRLHAHFAASARSPGLFRSLSSPPTNNTQTTCLRTAMAETNPEHHSTLVLGVVQREVAKILAFRSPSHVNVDQSLREIGLDSLAAIRTRNRLALLANLTLPTKMVFDYPSVRALSQYVLSQMQESATRASSDSTKPRIAAMEDPDRTIVNTACLDPGLVFDTSLVAASSQPAAVFVTGGTGFVGAFIVGKLLNLGVAVHCLVRGPSSATARQRMVQTLIDYELWSSEYEHLLTALAGDVALPLFGMSEGHFDRLAGGIDAICHSAAMVDWMRPLEDYTGPNVMSTQEVLRLASRGRPKTVHHISTVAVLPRYMGSAISEHEWEYGYSTSKWIAEQMVDAARWRGARASIYRLPYVSASSSTGHFRLDSGDFLHNLVAGCVALGSFPSIDADLCLVLPVDYLADSVVAAMVKDPWRIGQDFTFGNPSKAITFDQYFLMLARSGQRLLSFDEWRPHALRHAATHPASPLARIAAVLHGCSSAEDVAMLFRCPPVSRSKFASGDFPIPEIHSTDVQRYLNRIANI